MSVELLYTSASQGLKQGSRGFCTVLSTAGMPINLAQRLESLSGYRQLYPPQDIKAADNPVCFSHLRLSIGGRTVSILSRLSAYGVDYSQRTNKIAHHVVLDPNDQIAAGPVQVFQQPNVIRTSWSGQCETPAAGPKIADESIEPDVCDTWDRIAGDAGWAGMLAEAWSQPSGKTLWIIFNESQSLHLLRMIGEAIALLPPNRRWNATFSTYYTNLPPDIDCRVRCVLQGTDEARMSISRGIVIDLTKPLGSLPATPAVQAARKGHFIGHLPLPNVPTATTEEAAVGSSIERSDNPIQSKRDLPNIPPTLTIPSSQSSTRDFDSQYSTSNKSPYKTRALLAVAACLLVIGGVLTLGYLLRKDANTLVAGVDDMQADTEKMEETKSLFKTPETKKSPSEKHKDQKGSTETRKNVSPLDNPDSNISGKASSIEKSDEITIEFLNEQDEKLKEPVVAEIPEIPKPNSVAGEKIFIAKILVTPRTQKLTMENENKKDDISSWILDDNVQEPKLYLAAGTIIDYEEKPKKQLRVTIAAGAISKTLLVRIIDQDDPSNDSVVISVDGKSRVGNPIKAEISVSDPDGLQNAKGQWFYSDGSTLGDELDVSPTGKDSHTLQLAKAHVGKEIQFVVTYETKDFFATDGQPKKHSVKSNLTHEIMPLGIGKIQFEDLLKLKDPSKNKNVAGSVNVAVNVPCPINQPITNGTYRIGEKEKKTIVKGQLNDQGLRLESQLKGLFDNAKFQTTQVEGSKVNLLFTTTLSQKMDTIERNNDLFDSKNNSPDHIKQLLKAKFELEKAISEFRVLIKPSKTSAAKDMMLNVKEKSVTSTEAFIEFCEAKHWVDVIFEPLIVVRKRMMELEKREKGKDKSQNGRTDENDYDPWHDVPRFPNSENSRSKWPNISAAIESAKRTTSGKRTPRILDSIQMVFGVEHNSLIEAKAKWLEVGNKLDIFLKQIKKSQQYHSILEPNHFLSIEYRENEKQVDKLELDLAFELEVVGIEEILKKVQAIPKWEK